MNGFQFFAIKLFSLNSGFVYVDFMRTFFLKSTSKDLQALLVPLFVCNNYPFVKEIFPDAE